MNFKRRYDFWLNHKHLDVEDREKLLEIGKDEQLVAELFGDDLHFGTGGMRGIMGIGSERINKYTISKATLGVGKYLLTKFDDPSVVIGYDSRNNSSYFAKICADCFTSLNIKVYLFKNLRPTPEVSFAIRKLGASCGVVITASHNPKEYNGYKVYWDNGCQITPPVDKEIIDFVMKEKSMKCGEANDELIHILDEKMDEYYLQAVKEQSVKRWTNDVKVVYTPLNGTGGTIIPRLLKELGYEVYNVPEQINPDGNFPSVPKPNPENEEVYELGIGLAKKVDADLVIATDPDSDRMGCFCKLKKGEYYRLTGNVSGMVIGSYLLEHKANEMKSQGKDPVLIKTIVTSKLIEKIADEYDVKVIDTLTGFKYIGELMDKVDFLYGMEESYGVLAGDYARDKDAPLAAMLITEIAGWLKSKNMTLYDYVLYLYDKYGYSCDDIVNMTFPSSAGKRKMNAILSKLRNTNIEKIDDICILKRVDYLLDDTKLPKSDVLYYELDCGWFCIRRSGTEPKMKIYFESCSDEKLKKIVKSVKNLVNDLEKQV